MCVRRLQIPILLWLFFSSANAFPREITRIQIISTYQGWVSDEKEELIIEKRSGHYYAQKGKTVSDDAICALLEAINSRIIETLDPRNLGLTQTWLNENAGPALNDYVKSHRRAVSLGQKKHFLSSFTNLPTMEKVVDEYYASSPWTDDHPSIEIVVQTDEGRVVKITSSSQEEFMLPWYVSSVGPGNYFTWDAKFSRVIAQLLPKGFLNRERIAGLCFRQVLSRMVMEEIPICPMPPVRPPYREILKQ